MNPPATCAQCGETFQPKPIGRVPRHCSAACRRASRRKSFLGGDENALLERILVQCEWVEGCWEWRNSTTKGYGRIGIPNTQQRTWATHRVVYDLVKGLPEGMELDHLCRNPGCCFPDHLEPVTHAENVRRGASPSAVHHRQTHCVNGHEFTPENTYWYRYAAGMRRYCKACNRERCAQRRARRRSA